MCQSRKFGVHHPKFLTWTPNLIKWKGERQLYKKNEKETRFNRRLSRKGCPKHRVVLTHQVYLYQRNQVKAWHCHNMSHKLTLSTLRSKKSQLLHPSKWKSNEKKKKRKNYVEMETSIPRQFYSLIPVLVNVWPLYDAQRRSCSSNSSDPLSSSSLRQLTRSIKLFHSSARF